MRKLAIALLLLAAVVHPFVHADEPLACALAQGAVAPDAPFLAAPDVSRSFVESTPPGLAPAPAPGGKSSRAPPAV